VSFLYVDSAGGKNRQQDEAGETRASRALVDDITQWRPLHNCGGGI